MQSAVAAPAAPTHRSRRERRVIGAVRSPNAYRLAIASCECHVPMCACRTKYLKARAILALTSPGEAAEIATRFGINTDGDDPLSIDYAMAILGLNPRGVRGIVARLRRMLETNTQPSVLTADHDGDADLDDLLDIRVFPERVAVA